MDMKHDGASIFCLPEKAVCLANDEKRSPLDIPECPLGNEVCNGECYYYSEE